jgi:aerotaxis receptor
MRMNLPVTDHEIELSDTSTIVSATDLQGNITYANPYFIQISGYSAQELIGAPQNILRHPDMPAEAFADFWQTIRSGRSWSGMVKNRCKNGDYYWVLANVTPVIENGSTVGYMSVRTKPNRAQVAQAITLYARMKAGKTHGIALSQGAVVRTGWQPCAVSATCHWADALPGISVS